MKNYNVRITDGSESHDYEPMTKSQAIEKVEGLKLWLNEHNYDRKLFIVGPSNTFLNPDGNHDITGKAW